MSKRSLCVPSLPVLALLSIFALLTTASAAAAQLPGDSPDDYVELKKGVKILDLEVGSGEVEVSRGDLVQVYYTGRFEDGSVFDTNRRSGAATLSFRIGDERVVKGLEIGVVGMKQGGKRRIVIPPKLGYGKRGIKGRVPGNSVLIFDVEMLTIAP